MYCPQCGTDSPSTLQYCRACGANLKVIGKAVALSEAIARSDRGPLPKLREMVKSLKVDQVTEEVSRALDKMNQEIAQVSEKPKQERRSLISFKKKTAAERRESQITKGIVSLFWGAGLAIFLYYLSAALVLKIPPHILKDIPFEVDPVVRMLWVLGVIPTVTGLGHIFAGLLIRPQPQELPPVQQPQSHQVEFPRTPAAETISMNSVPRSVTEHTTNLLHEK